MFPACCEIVCCAFLICCVCEMYHPFIFTVHTVIFDLRAPCEAHRTLFSTQTSPWGSLITLLLSPGLINGTLTYQPICGSEGQRGGVQKEETTDVPQTRQGQRDGGRRTERLQRMETDESTPSSQGKPFVGRGRRPRRHSKPSAGYTGKITAGFTTNGPQLPDSL